MPGFEVRSSLRVAEAAFLDLFEEEVETPDGELITRYTVRHPGAVVIVPVDDEGRVVMVRQFRVAARRSLLELPAGKREPDEPPEITAARELEEEVALRPGSLVKLAEFYNSPGFTDEYTHVYLASDLLPGQTDLEAKSEERHMEVVRLPFDVVDALVGSRELVDAKSLIGLELARRYLDGTYQGCESP